MRYIYIYYTDAGHARHDLRSLLVYSPPTHSVTTAHLTRPSTACAPGVPPGAGGAHPVVSLWETLLAQPEVEAVGLGARDSLRLEAGLCLCLCL